MLTVAGNQVPLILLVEVNGKNGSLLPLQISVRGAKFGIALSIMVCEIEIESAQYSTFGVKVYVPDFVLFIVAGNQVPLIPFVEIEGKIDAILPLQISFSDTKGGSTFFVIVCVIVTVFAHCPAFGVKV